MQMRSVLLTFVLAIVGIGFSIKRSDAHGTPIRVFVDEMTNALVVDVSEPDQANLAGGTGFAPWFLAEDDEDGDPQGAVNLPGFGPAVLWSVPGIDITEMNSNSSLELEILVRPVVDEDATKRRALWYWNPSTEMVEDAPADSAMYLLALHGRSLTIPFNQVATLQPLPLADTLAADYKPAEHHGLLAYALDNLPAATPGVYGFFARLTSNLGGTTYAASNPFLVAFNYNVSNDDVFSAARAINRSALLPGDYNHDDIVDGDDYLTWKSLYGATYEEYELADGNGNGIIDAADYTVWRNNVGATLGSGATANGGAEVPEPASITVVVCVFATLTLYRFERNRRVPARSESHGIVSLPTSRFARRS